MSATANRNQRLVMVRNSEHRRAQIGLAKAQADLTRLAELSTRLNLLRKKMANTTGPAQGFDLRMVNEMAERLDVARTALVAPLQAAADLRDEQSTVLARAMASEEVAERRLDDARKDDEAKAEQQRDSRRIHRARKPQMRLVESYVA